MTHGTYSAYKNHRCSCDKCRAANRAYQKANAEKQRRLREKKYAAIAVMPPVPCECGCGRLIPPITRAFRPARFARGHNPGGESTRFKPGENKGRAGTNWQGGRKQHHIAGYVMVYVGTGHPMARYAGASYAYEHRLVMSEAIGRPLRKDEEVHHINGDRADNRLENLQLRQGRHGTGVAYRCCDCGSHNVEPIQLIDRDSGQTTLCVQGGESVS